MAVLRPAEGGLLWRTAKADVEHELMLPPQSHRTTFLTLSAIERHFYMRQHQACHHAIPLQFTILRHMHLLAKCRGVSLGQHYNICLTAKFMIAEQGMLP